MLLKLLSEKGLSFDRLKNFVLVADRGSIRAVSGWDVVQHSHISRQIRELEVFSAGN